MFPVVPNYPQRTTNNSGTTTNSGTKSCKENAFKLFSPKLQLSIGVRVFDCFHQEYSNVRSQVIESLTAKYQEVITRRNPQTGIPDFPHGREEELKNRFLNQQKLLIRTLTHYYDSPDAERAKRGILTEIQYAGESLEFLLTQLAYAYANHPTAPHPDEVPQSRGFSPEALLKFKVSDLKSEINELKKQIEIKIKKECLQIKQKCNDIILELNNRNFQLLRPEVDDETKLQMAKELREAYEDFFDKIEDTLFHPLIITGRTQKELETCIDAIESYINDVIENSGSNERIKTCILDEVITCIDAVKLYIPENSNKKNGLIVECRRKDYQTLLRSCKQEVTKMLAEPDPNEKYDLAMDVYSTLLGLATRAWIEKHL